MRATATHTANEGLTHDLIDVFLDEAERALLDVEARADEPGRRIATNEAEPDGVSELRLAIAELADSFPGIHYDLESIGDRLRNVGVMASATELEQHPHVRHLVRLSLEVFFRQYPTSESYEAESERADEFDDDGQTPAEIYEAYRQLLLILRQRLS